MVSCAHRSCSSRTAVDKKKSSGITFHKFPNDPERRKVWVQFVNRGAWTPTTTSALCSKHFSEIYFDRTSKCYVRLRDNAVPSLPPTQISSQNQSSWSGQVKQERSKYHQHEQPSSNTGTASVSSNYNNSVNTTVSTGTRSSDSRMLSRSDPRVAYYSGSRQYSKYPQSYTTSSAYDRRSPYATGTEYGTAMVPTAMTSYDLKPAAFSASYPPPLPPPPPPPPSYPSSHASGHNQTSVHADVNSHATHNYSYASRGHGQTTASRLTHGQGQTLHNHMGNVYDYYQRKRRNSSEMDKNKGSGKKKKKPLSQNIPTRKDWSVEEARKALEVEKEFNKRHKSQSLIIKFPDLELNRDIVSKFHPAIDSVHFQQPSTPRFCFITLNNKASAEQVISDLSKIKFGNGYLIAEHKKDREDEMNIGPEDIDPLTLYVGNLAQEVTKDDIVKAYPKQKRIDIGFAKKMKYTRYAFVCFRRVKDAIEAFQNTHATEMYSKSLIVRFRRLHGTVGMPGEPKPQNPTKRVDRTVDDNNSSLNGMDVDLANLVNDSEEYNSSYFNTSAEDRSVVSIKIHTSMNDTNRSRSNSFSIEDSIAQENLFTPIPVKREPYSDSYDDGVTSFYSSEEGSAMLHRRKGKSEVKAERAAEYFSDDDLDNEDEPLPLLFSSITSEPSRVASEASMGTSVTSVAFTGTSEFSRLTSEPSRDATELDRVTSVPSTVTDERSRVTNEPSNSDCPVELIHLLHRPMLEPKVEPCDERHLSVTSEPARVTDERSRVTNEPSNSNCSEKTVHNTLEGYIPAELIDSIHRPMLEPKVEPCDEQNLSEGGLIREKEIKVEIFDCPSVLQSSSLDQIHRPMLEPKNEGEIKEEKEDCNDSDMEGEGDNFLFNNMLKNMDKPKVTL